MYKLLRGFLPAYLSMHIDNPPTCHYATRSSISGNFFIQPRFYRLSSSLNSFFPRTIKAWNALPETVKQSPSPHQFKVLLKLHLLKAIPSNPPVKYHNLSNGSIGRFLIQISLGLSPLKSQLFKYNLTDNPFCQICKLDVETPLHYFTGCPPLTTLAVELRSNVRLLLLKFPRIARFVGDLHSNEVYLNLLLNGVIHVPFSNSSDLDTELSPFYLDLYKITTNYVFHTKRLLPID